MTPTIIMTATAIIIGIIIISRRGGEQQILQPPDSSFGTLRQKFSAGQQQLVGRGRAKPRLG
jgi:hypothetical protein